MSARMTLRQLESTPEFRALSAKGKLFVQTYLTSLIETGNPDPVFATQVGFQNANARTFSYQVLQQKKVQAALRVFRNFGKSRRQIVMQDLQAEIDATKPGTAARKKLLALYANVFGTKSSKK